MNKKLLARLLESNNFGRNLSRYLLDGAQLRLTPTHTMIPVAGAVTPSMTRATVATVQNNDGYLVTALAGELRFGGARRVYNLWTTSSATLANLANKSLTLAAGTYQFSMGAGTGTATFSGTGGATGTLAASASGRVHVAKTITAGTFVVTASVADLVDLQVVSLASETDQTTIREYVSVGVLSAPSYHGSGVDGVKCFATDLSGNPLTTLQGPLIELAATNLCLQSNSFNTAPWVNTGNTATQNLIGPDGATSGWTIVDTSASVLGTTAQAAITLTAATYTASAFFKKTTGAQASYPLFGAYLAAGTTSLALCTVDTTNGIATAWTAYTGFTGVSCVARCTSFNSLWWRVEVVFTGTAVAWQVDIFPAGTTNPTQSTGVSDVAAGGTTGNCGVFGVQLELGAKATSYFPTTTAAATRNKDEFKYTGAEIANYKSIVVRGFKRDAGFANDGHVISLSDGTTTNYADFSLTSATAIAFEGKATAQQWNQTTGTYTAGQVANAGWSMATNDIKASFNGTAQTQDTSATVPTITILELGMLAGAEQLNGYAGKAIYAFTRNLSQSELDAVSK